MSTFLESHHSERIKSAEDLRNYFQKFSKPETKKLVGAECEVLGVDSETGAALPYYGERGIQAVLKGLAYEFGYEEIAEESHVVALRKGGTVIGLEPGGQIELAAEPVQSVHEVRKQLDQFFFELKTISHFLGKIDFLAYGIQPFSPNSEIGWVPKKRYAIMADYMAKHGRLSHDMMKRTASNQASFDYTDEDDAFQKMCLVMKLTPIAYAMFANSSFSKGRPSGYVSERMHIWHYTDPSRSGLMVGALCPKASFESYLDYLLDLPMMFIVRNGKWIKISNLTFRRYLERGSQGAHATVEDFELHMSTAFPEARFKQYLEVRSADGQRSHLIPAVAAFWKGILYDQTARHSAALLVHRWRESDFVKLYRNVAKGGLRVKIHGTSVLELARELVRISEKGLAAQPVFNESEQDERIYLEILEDEVLRTGETPGGAAPSFVGERFSKGPANPDPLFEHMTKNIFFHFGDLKVMSQWNDSKTAKAIRKALPAESSVSRWGDEIYFEIPVTLPPENATRDVDVGDVAYWPEGACLCLFFGKTPASTGEKPRPASEVNLVGKFTAVPELLRRVKSGTRVKVTASV